MMKTSRCGETSRATTEAEPSRDEVLVTESAMKAIAMLNESERTMSATVERRSGNRSLGTNRSAR